MLWSFLHHFANNKTSTDSYKLTNPLTQGRVKGCWGLRLPGSRADFCYGRGLGMKSHFVPQKLKPLCQYWYTNFDVLENEYTKIYLS